MSSVTLDEILELPAAERVEIAQEIWESVFNHPETLPLTQAQTDELERRWRAFQQNPEEGEPWHGRAGGSPAGPPPARRRDDR